MRVVYFGTSHFAASILRRLGADPSKRPALVVTPPDRPRGRGRRVSPAPAAAAAAELGIEVLRTEATEAPEAMARIRAANPEVGVVCAFGQLLREPLLSELELLNVHPSLLPRWRGAAPIERAIMAGDAQTGVSIMRVTAGLDSGPVSLREAIPVGDDDFGELAPKLEELAGTLLVQALERHERGELDFAEQDDAAATYAPKIEPGERRLDPAEPAIELECRVRGLTPHVGTYLELAGGERLGVVKARAEHGELETATLVGGEALRLGCGVGVLRLLRVRPAGGRDMDAADYLRGHPLPELS